MLSACSADVRFFTGKQYLAAAFHQEVYSVYGPKVMSEGVDKIGSFIYKHA